MISLSAFPSFELASSEVLEYLYSRLGFRLWMITRTESDDWIVLQAQDRCYNVSSGDVFRWTDSFCSRMVQGQGPRIAPRSREVPAYLAAPIGEQVPIGAYVGVPLSRADGQFFGTLCAIDPQPMPDHVTSELALVEIMARLLMTVLEKELEAQQEHRRAERARTESMSDQLTGLYNRRGWDELVAAEDRRCHRYGHPACLLSIDLDGLKKVNDEHGHARGDALLCRAAEALKGAVRASDIVARIGGDEFSVLAVESDENSAQALVSRLQAALALENVAASIGMSMRSASGSLAEALAQADHRMYEDKHCRKRDQQLSIASLADDRTAC